MPVTLTLPEEGGSTGLWGGVLNAALSALASAVNALETALAGKAAAAHQHAQSDVTGLETALSGLVPTGRTVSAGVGLTGGGDLTADRALAVAYGTTSGTAAQGNDGRLSDARVPLAHGHDASDIVSGTLPVGRGGTGATSASGARTALGAAPASAATRTYAFSYPGTLAVTSPGSGGRRYNNTGGALTISSVQVSVSTAPTGSALIVDVLRNGTSVFASPGDRPTIAAGQNTATATPTAGGAWSTSDYLEVVVTQVGSTTPGSGLVGEVIAS